MVGGNQNKGKGIANDSQQRGTRRSRESTSSSSQSPPPQNVNDPRAQSSSASQNVLIPAMQLYTPPQPRQQLPPIAPLLEIADAPQLPDQQQQYQQQQASEDPGGLQLPPLQLRQAQQGASRGQGYGGGPLPRGYAPEPLQYPKPNDFSGLRDPQAVDSPYRYGHSSAGPSASHSTTHTSLPPPMPQAPPASQPPSQAPPPQPRPQTPSATLRWTTPQTGASQPPPPKRLPRQPHITTSDQLRPLLAATQFVEAPQQQLLTPGAAVQQPIQQPITEPARRMPPCRKPPHKKPKGKDLEKDEGEDPSKSPPGKK